MKKNDKLSNNSWLQRLTLFVVSLICVVGSVQASNRYYYRYTATPTTGGKVYATDDENSTISYSSSAVTGTGRVSSSNDNGEYVTLHFYASPDNGYSFVGWRKNGTGNIVSTSLHFPTSEFITSTSEERNVGTWLNPKWVDNRTQVNYTAYFQQITGCVKVVSTNTQRGYVTIDNPNNTMGSEVTITAYPDISKGIVFLGWKTSNLSTAPYVSSNNPYTLTVTQEDVTYYAFFSAPATSVYCILRNYDTNNYLCVIGNGQASMQTQTVEVEKGLITYTTNIEDGCNFVNGLKTISSTEAVNNPLIVLKRVSTNANGKITGDLVSDVKMVKSEGASPTPISTQQLIGNNGYPLIFASSPKYPNAYRIYSHLTRSVRTGLTSYEDIEFDTYLCDEGNNYVSLKPFKNISEATGIDWEVINLTEGQKDGAFGANANAKYTKGDKYYTSMYAPFAYKLLDGVNAYYLNPDDDNYDETTNTLKLTQIPAGEIVRANMPVIIECSEANAPTSNRLLPVTPPDNYDYTHSYDDNLLLGYNQLYSRDNYTIDYNKKFQEVENLHDFMYVFSIKNNELGFYHYGGSTIPKNKAYLNLPHTWEQIKEDLLPNSNVKLQFGHQAEDENFNSINLSNEVVDDIDLPIYNLQGVQVKNPEKGIYIRGGKKYLVK